MESDLRALEEKVLQLVAVCRLLRRENISLRQELAQTEDDARQLRENMELAGDRLEALIASLPGEGIDE